jgi:hypothetical protein
VLISHFSAVNLKDFVGKVGVYGHVNDSLTASMGAYAQFVEENDLEEIQRVRAEGRAHAAEKMEEMWATYDVSNSHHYIISFTSDLRWCPPILVMRAAANGADVTLCGS